MSYVIGLLLVLSQINGQIYQSNIDISSFGYEFQPAVLNDDQLDVFIAKTFLRCSLQCNQRPQCRVFDYDSASNQCRLFVSGSIGLSLSPTSQVGTIRYSVDQYKNQGTECTTTNTNRYLTCDSTNTYQCPTGLWWNGTMCTPLYWTAGTQVNLSASLLHGWSMCYNGTYDYKLNSSLVDGILSICNRSKLLMACGSINSITIYSLAAMGFRQDVLYNCSNTPNCVNPANNVQWYYITDVAWGFANGPDAMNRVGCDTALQSPSTRLCWHMNGNDGYRCGSAIFDLSMNSSLWQRVMWHAD